MSSTGRSLLSARTAGLGAMGAVAGFGAWALGPRAALAVAVGLAAAGGLLVLDWLRGHVRRLHAEAAHARAAQAGVERRVATLEKRLRADLAAAEQRLRRAGNADLVAARKRTRADLAELERRLQISGSGDLAALEKRLRGTCPHREVA